MIQFFLVAITRCVLRHYGSISKICQFWPLRQMLTQLKDAAMQGALAFLCAISIHIDEAYVCNYLVRPYNAGLVSLNFTSKYLEIVKIWKFVFFLFFSAAKVGQYKLLHRMERGSSGLFCTDDVIIFQSNLLNFDCWKGCLRA